VIRGFWTKKSSKGSHFNHYKSHFWWKVDTKVDFSSQRSKSMFEHLSILV